MRLWAAPHKTDLLPRKGKYKYHRHDLLDDIPHRKIVKSVIIIRSSDLGKVMDYVRDRVEDIHVRTIVLTEGDVKALQEEDHTENGLERFMKIHEN